MSNLGWYQILTTVAKQVGGPKKLIALIFSGGILTGGGTLLGANAIIKGINKKLDQKKHEEKIATIYKVNKECTSKEGLTFSVGMRFKVLECDGDAALIEIIDDKNNPYFISAAFLSSISDYKI